jgi:alanine dehydrogenase
MHIGVPAEVKRAEHRVAITPAGVRELRLTGHEVLVQAGAGLGSSLADADYARAGARIVDDADTAWGDAELVLKVKEPTPDEYRFFRRDLTLFTFLHLAASKELTDALAESGCTAVAYETVRGPDGGLVLLAPMSEIAGRMAAQVGAQLLAAPAGGRGVLMGGVAGVIPAHVVVIGAGSAGSHAAAVATGMGADVSVLDVDVERLRDIDRWRHGRLRTLTSNRLTLEEQVAAADLVIGAVLVPGARAPVVLTEAMVESMPRHAGVIDISIDQGGCVATSHVTTHDEPTFRAHGVIHYAVGNMPGAMPRTATYALTNATLPYVQRLADHGVRPALLADEGFAEGVNVTEGAVTEAGVAQAHGHTHTPLPQAWA